MSQPTVDEVLQLLDKVDSWTIARPFAEFMIDRIRKHGIAPPDGWVLVRSDILAVQVECKCGLRYENRVSEFAAPKPEVQS